MNKGLPHLLKIGIIAAAYFLLGKLALSLAVVNGIVSTLWPASGLALAALLRYGIVTWPGIFIGAVLVNYLPGNAVWVAVAAGAGNTLAGLVGAIVINKVSGTNRYFDHTRNVLKFITLGGLLSPVIAATVGVGSLFLSGAIQAAGFPFNWFSWWVSEATGVIVLAPLLLTWLDRDEKWRKPSEFFVLMVLVILTSQLIFSGSLTGDIVKSLTFKFLLLPYYVWLVFRFGPKEIATATLTVEAIAVFNTLLKLGTITGVSNNELILSLQVFVSFIMVAALVLNAMVNERKRMIEDLARLEKLNLIGEMAAGIAHEIRNPMTTIRGFLQMLALKQEEPKQIEYFNLMINELDRANDIITEYLLLARNRPMELREQNLNRIIKAIQPLVEADALNADKRVEVFLGDIPNVSMDEKEIRQLIFNLCRNGLEAMDAGGKLTLGTFVRDESVVLSVIDEGRGIAPQIIKNLGTPFMTTKETGTGLGLAVSYSIAEKHGAVIKVDTGPKGTTFYVKFKIERKTGLSTSQKRNGFAKK